MAMTASATEIDDFERYRPALFGVAYRMLGSVTEAEDVLQEAWLRWQSADRTKVQAPRAYLITVVTRLSLDVLRSARVQREQYVGPWLPEPLVIETAPGPQAKLDTAESISMAFLLVLERLAPVERAVFLLREVFDYSYPEIAEIVGKSEVACRQVFSRAKKHVTQARPRFRTDEHERERITRLFVDAIEADDVDGVVRLLAEDITVVSDGGGKVAAALRPVSGRDAVGRFLNAFSQKTPVVAIRLGEVNGEPAVMMLQADGVAAVIHLEVHDGLIQEMFVQRNPEKLAAVYEAFGADPAEAKPAPVFKGRLRGH